MVNSKINSKLFLTDTALQNGIITYACKNDDLFPKFSVKGNNSYINIDNAHKKYKEGNTLITFDGNPGDEASLLIDFGRYRVSVFSYTIGMKEAYTPPYEWDVSGKNEGDEEWTIISSPPETNYLCGLPSSSASTCTNTTVNKFYSNNDKLFRHIRFRILKARRQSLIYYRVQRFEIYGALTGFRSCKTNYNKCNRNTLIYSLIFLINTYS